MDISPYLGCCSKGQDSLARLFADLSHPLRLRVVCQLLVEGEACVCSMARRLGVDQPTLSHHLRILKDHGTVGARREGANVFYRLTDARVVALLAVLDLKEQKVFQREES